jgi:hypothetical protein
VPNPSPLFCHQNPQIVRDFGLYTKTLRTNLGICPHLVQRARRLPYKKASVNAGFSEAEGLRLFSFHGFVVLG